MGFIGQLSLRPPADKPFLSSSFITQMAKNSQYGWPHPTNRLLAGIPLKMKKKRNISNSFPKKERTYAQWMMSHSTWANLANVSDRQKQKCTSVIFVCLSFMLEIIIGKYGKQNLNGGTWWLLRSLCKWADTHRQVTPPKKKKRQEDGLVPIDRQQGGRECLDSTHFF